MNTWWKTLEWTPTKFDAILELREISKHFQAHCAVANVSLGIARGEFFSLLGPSGCGKTTTLRLIAGFETPTSGEVWLNGARIDGLPPYRRNVSTVFQNYALFPHLSVRGNVEFGLRRQRAESIEARVRKALEQVRLAGKESRRPAELSGGERQRVALARSLVLAPDVLLLDEPLSALDPQLRKQVRSELKDLQRRSGVTFLFVTHDQEEALSLSDRMAVMNGGALEQAGSPQEIYQRPRTKFVASFIGAMNWIGGVGIRPENLRISWHAPEGGQARRAIVMQSVFLGACIHVTARLEGGEETLLAQIPPDSAAFAPGDPVHVWWSASDELRFPE
jgi:ABC-type Fe3+/spermidine/putrescine transport system ATPase subunit